MSRSQIFYVTMNGEHWSRPPAHYTECALSPNGKGSRSYHKCERRVRDSSYQFTERPNITTVYPDVADYTKSTSVTIVGEGFQPSSRATLRVGDDAVCGPGRNETCLTTDVTFVDSFTLVVVIPPHPQHWVAPRLGDGPSNFTIPVVLEVALNGQVMRAVTMKAPMDSTGMVVKELSCVKGGWRGVRGRVYAMYRRCSLTAKTMLTGFHRQQESVLFPGLFHATLNAVGNCE